MNTKTQAVELLLDANRGIYIPRDAADLIGNPDGNWQGVTPEQLDVLRAGPDQEWYWEEWDQVLNNVEYHEDGHVWRLHQDGDLFALCDELMTDEERTCFGFEE